MAERKRKRVSKNKKKSWRKHVDIRDVEDFLEDERAQERTGGLVAEKKDDDLFFVDKSTQDEEPASKRKRRREPKPLKCQASLVPYPRIKPVRVTNSVRRPEPRISKRQLEKEAQGIVTKKVLTARRQRQKARDEAITKSRAKKELPKATCDLWEEKDSIQDAVEDYYLEKTRKKPVHVPKHHSKKPSIVPAVEVSHPGASYNPSYDDHQELLRKANTIEEQKLRVQEKLQRSLTSKFPSSAEAPTQKTYLKEMSAGLFDGDSDSGDEEETEEVHPEDLESTALNPPVRRENKKTELQRRKDKGRKMQEEKVKLAKLAKQAVNEFNRLKSIKKEVRTREEGLKLRAAKKAELKIQTRDKPRKLGKLKYEEKDLEIKLSDELEGSLRLLKPEGHLLADRFKSMQKRNIIETRKRAKFTRKFKLKAVEKREFKDYTLNENMKK